VAITSCELDLRGISHSAAQGLKQNCILVRTCCGSPRVCDQTSDLNQSNQFFYFKKGVKMSSIAVSGTPSHRYGMSLAIWDHTVLPVTRHK